VDLHEKFKKNILTTNILIIINILNKSYIRAGFINHVDLHSLIHRPCQFKPPFTVVLLMK